MHSHDLVSAIHHRVRRPSTWGAALLFAAAWLGVRGLLGLPMKGFALGETVLPLLLLFGTLLLGPVPWQWTGDGRALAPFARGLLQALPWNAAWIFLGLALLAGLGLPLGPRPGGLMAAHAGPGAPPPPPPRPESLAPPGPPQPRGEGPRRPAPPPEPWKVGLLNLPLVLLMGWFLADRERTESSERRLQRLADEARGASLQAQMNPHVLFNALSGLSELVHEDPDAAEEALLELSRMLRLLLHQVSRPLMPLREERELIRSYLTLEKIRFGSLLTVTWVWPDWVENLDYPPLLLMPLVENAIKHGIAQSTLGGQLRIEAERQEGLLHLRVGNTGLEESHRGGHGMGLRNVEARLALLDPKARFKISREGAWTFADLWLPLPVAP